MKFIVYFLFFLFSQLAAADVNLANLIDENTKVYVQIEKNSRATIFFSYLNGCPLVNRYLGTLMKIKEKYSDKIQIIILDSSANHTALKDAKEKIIQKKLFPFVIDTNSTIAKKFNLSVATEILVFNEQFILKYQGAIDDQYSIQLDKLYPENKYLDSVIKKIISKKKFEYFKTTASGCMLNLYENKN